MAGVKTCSVCGFENDPSQVLCQRKVNNGICGMPLRGEGNKPPRGTLNISQNNLPFLEFSWGNFTVEKTLRIGRDPDFSPLAEHMSEFVSRKHAVLVFRDGRLEVTPLNSTNPTYLNGAPLPEGETKRLTHLDEIGFSKEMVAKVRFH